MEIELNDEKRGAIYLTQTVPENLSKQLIVNAIPFVLNESSYQALFQLIPGDGFSIWYSTYRIGKERTILKARGGIPVLELRIAVKNQIEGTWEKILQPSLPQYHFSLGFTPFVSTHAIFEANTEYITIDFHFDLAFLEDLGVDFKALEIFLNKVRNEQPAELSPYPHACPSEMKDAVQAICTISIHPPARSFSINGKQERSCSPPWKPSSVPNFFCLCPAGTGSAEASPRQSGHCRKFSQLDRSQTDLPAVAAQPAETENRV